MIRILTNIRETSSGVESLLREYGTELLGKGEPLVGKLKAGSYNLVIYEGGVDQIDSIRNADPRVEIILIGQDEAAAVKAVMLGASAYFAMPVEPDSLRDTIERIGSSFEVRRATAELESKLRDRYTFAGIVVGRNPAMLEIFSQIKRIAPYYRTVLISGETGTGKEVVAKALHWESPGAMNPFLVCNCGGLTETLIESELFGHRRGSFTGAIYDKAGLFEAAGDGNIFLDEVGELPLAFQPHLLRVLQDGEFRSIGSATASKARCRVIAATNRDLAHETRAGRFRKDLFYRLTPLHIHLPPLRERKDDIPLLSRFILDAFNRRTGRGISGISLPAQSMLMAHDWPGNIRELENVIEHAAMLTSGSFISREDLPPQPGKAASAGHDRPHSLELAVKEHISEVLRQFDGNRTRAAKALGISRRALIRKIEKYSL